MTVQPVQYLIVGGGVAGLRAAITLSNHGQVLVVNKGPGSSPLAQGGVAVALDAPATHVADTISAGKGACDPEAVRTMVQEGPERIADLVDWGARFDREPSGDFALAREAAHSHRRILRAGGDATGKEMVRALQHEARSRDGIQWLDDWFVSELLTHRGRCVGAVLVPAQAGDHADRVRVVASSAVLLASGGAGQVYARTSNPPSATGDGIALAARAGAVLDDMEFVQFHPTVLAGPYPPFLVSEAMRGEGGVLLDKDGHRFMPDYHPQAELAPRDDVARAIWQQMATSGVDHVGLDMSCMSRTRLAERFPTIYEMCDGLGLDATREPIPVSPAAHFIMGGVQVDGWGRTSIPGLFAAGEVACTGVHGANRLASNSLLEALVFGDRAGRAMVNSSENIASDAGSEAAVEVVESAFERVGKKAVAPRSSAENSHLHATLGHLMWNNLGLVRDAKGMGSALEWIDKALTSAPYTPFSRAGMECLNLLRVAREIARAALVRPDGLGAHYRSDGGAAEDTTTARA